MGNTRSNAKKFYIEQNYLNAESTDAFASTSQHKLSSCSSLNRSRCPKKLLRTTNPFLIFYLQMHSKHPTYHVTRVAAVAGKEWSQLPMERKQKYIDLANEEKKRREKMIRKKKRKSPKALTTKHKQPKNVPHKNE